MNRVVFAVGLLLLSSCSALWFVNADEEGLLCGPDDGNPRCLDGFFCASDNTCKPGAFRKEGDVCTQTEECGANLFCGDAVVDFCSNGDPDNINCNLFPADTGGLRCRSVCGATTPCGNGLRCFPVVNLAVDGLCQPGACETNSQCGNGLCLAKSAASGKTGLCFEFCDPLSCIDGRACTGCGGQDGLLDSNRACELPFFGGNEVGGLPVCFEIPPEILGVGAGCNVNGECGRGLTCFPTGAGPRCLQFCELSTQCPVDFPNCRPVGDAGVCEPQG
jgi:hypothetical protein